MGRGSFGREVNRFPFEHAGKPFPFVEGPAGSAVVPGSAVAGAGAALVAVASYDGFWCLFWADDADLESFCSPLGAECLEALPFGYFAEVGSTVGPHALESPVGRGEDFGVLLGVEVLYCAGDVVEQVGGVGAALSGELYVHDVIADGLGSRFLMKA